MMELLRSTELFGALPEAVLAELAPELEAVSVDAGEALVRQGAADDALYVVREGRLRVTTDNELLAEIGPGQCTGDFAFLTGDPRNADVVALTACHVLKLDRAAFDRLAERHAGAAVPVREAIARRLRRAQLARAVERSDLLAGLPAQVLEELAKELEPVAVASGELLVRQGEPGDCLYLLASGRLRVTVDGPPERVVAELGPGEAVGEMTVLTGEPRTATVRAIRDSHAGRLSRAAFERLLARYPGEIAPLFTRKIVERYRGQIAPVSPRRGMHTFALAPSAPGVPLEAVAARFEAALAGYGSTLRLTSEGVDSRLGRAGASQAGEQDSRSIRLVEWLSSREVEHRFVLYQCDAAFSPWTRRCLRQADHVLVVCDAASGEQPGELEARLAQAQSNAEVTLVVLHDDATALPSGTSRILRARRVSRHYHVRRGVERDYARLARLVTGQGIGVVFGGGAARGIGHAGVVRAMAELGIPIDLVGGTSMGAVIAAECAMEYGWERMVQVTTNVCVRAFKGDFTLPLVAFLTGGKLARLMLDIGRDIDIEDVWLPFFCVSANLTRAEVKVHTQGSGVKSLLASTRIPAALPPVIWDGDLLVDGGLINNVPVDIMRTFPGCGTVIAVDVSAAVEPITCEDYGEGLSGWRTLFRRLNPFGKAPQVPSLLRVMMRTVDFGGAAYKSRIIGQADVYIHPPLDRFGMSDFARGPEMAEEAWRDAREKLRGAGFSPRTGFNRCCPAGLKSDAG